MGFLKSESAVAGQECGIIKLGHKLVLAKGIIALFGPQGMDMAGQLGDAKKNRYVCQVKPSIFLKTR